MKFIHVTETPEKPFIFDEKERYVVFFHNVSGKYDFQMNAEGAELFIFGLFTGEEDKTYRIETVQHHNAPGSYSDLYIKGVFRDSSKFHYQGLIRIEKEGQNSHAYQKNQNLILSPNVFVESNPFLEILANEVFCTHGSTTGRLNKEELYYAQTRGLSYEQAQQLLVEGFMNELIERVQAKAPEFEYTP